MNLKLFALFVAAILFAVSSFAESLDLPLDSIGKKN